MTTLLARDALKGNILDQIANLEVRLRALEELGGGGAGGASGGASLPPTGDSHTVAVSFNDAFPNYLGDKLVGDSPLLVVELNDGGNEQLLLSIAPHLTPDAHHAPVTAGDGISLSGQQVAVNSSVVRTSRSITAGSGLTGGGDLSANRTINVGAGAGITVSADAVALTTPGGLSATSTNNAAGNHTHAIAASANPGAAESLLKTTSGGLLTLHSLTLTNDLILGRVDSDALPKVTAVRDLGSTGLKWRNLHLSGSVNANAGLFAGAVDVGDDLTVGLNVLQVDVSGQRVGINRAADPQFQLDVLGNMRASGYIVGQHAIQLSDAVGIWHFDGANPDDFDGSLLGHKGQTPEQAYGPTVFRPGRFGKAVQLAGATTNLITNPIMQTGTLGSVPTGYNGGGSGNLTQLSEAFSYVGTRSVYIERVGSVVALVTSINYVAGVSYRLSFYVRRPDGAAVTTSDVTNAFIENTLVGIASITPAENSWYRVVSNTRVAAATITSNAGMYIGVGRAFYVDGMQVEASSYATPLAYGDMPGHAWTGTPHASTSTRAGNALAYPQQPLGQSGTVMFWWKPSGNTGAYQQLWGQGGLALFYDGGSQQMRLFNSNGPVYGGYPMAITPETWYFLALVWTPQEMRLYVNPNSGTPSDTQAISGSNLDGTMILSHPDNSANGLIDELVVVNRALDADLIRAIFESNAPVFAETSTWSFQLPNSLVWADEEGLWMRRATGEAAFGMVGVDGKSWGGLTLDAGDLLIGNTAGNYVRFDASAGTVTFAGDGDGITNIDGGNIQTGTITADSLDVSQLSAITADLGTVTAGHISGTTIEAGQGALLLDQEGMNLVDAGTLIQFQSEGLIRGAMGMFRNDTIRLLSVAGAEPVPLNGDISFEEGLGIFTGFEAVGWLANVTRVDTVAYQGDYSLHFVWRWNEILEIDYIRSGEVATSAAAILIKGFIKPDANGWFANDNFTVRWFDSSNNLVGGGGMGVDWEPTPGWVEFQSVVARPSGATKFKLEIGNLMPITGDGQRTRGAYIDNLSIRELSAAQYAMLDMAPDSLRISANSLFLNSPSITIPSGTTITGPVSASSFLRGARLRLNTLSSNPAFTADVPDVYVKGTKLIVLYRDGATTRYKYLELSGTGATWTHTTTPP